MMMVLSVTDPHPEDIFQWRCDEDEGGTHTLQLPAAEDAGQQQLPQRDGQQQHEGERCSCCRRHDDPQQRQAQQLDQSEQMHP